MKRLAAFLLLAEAVALPDLRYFRSERPVQIPASSATHTCLVVDANLFAHAAPALADVRLYHDRTETPYLIQTSAPPAVREQTMAALNLGTRGGQTVFDAAMPATSYSDLRLNVTGKDFLATVTVSGSQQQSGPATRIGAFTIFDLSRQRLGRSTVLHLPTLDFRFLHFRIAGALHPEQIGGLAIEQRSTAKPIYLTVAKTMPAAIKGRSTLIEFTVPAQVPVERIEFVPARTPANFSRDVTVAVTATSPNEQSEAGVPPQTVTSYGNLLRVHTVQDGRAIDQEHLDFDGPQAIFDAPAKWTITIENGDDAPLVPSAVRLQMLERDLCFEANGANGYSLYYGDAALSPPRYDLGQLVHFRVQDAARAVAQAEQPNAEYQPRPDARPFTERHPVLLWIALALVVALLGILAFRTASTETHPAS
ncbi:MAG: DUF3999 family protein [Terracidiphilus sp.]